VKSLSVIIPAYNEEAAIASIIRRMKAVAPEIKRTHGLDFVEIIVVNDGSTDKTFENASKEKGVSIITYDKNRDMSVH